MKRFVLTLCGVVAIAVLAWSDTPTLSILTTSRGEVQIPVASITKISYDKTAGTEMYVGTNTGTQTYQLSDVVRMTLSNMPQATALEELTAAEAADAKKILINGVVYIVRDGKVYTLKGEAVK